MADFFDFDATSLGGDPVDLAEYRGKTVLVVNVASKCGFTPQYEGLEALYRQYKDKDFVVLGFPSNQFGNQEPGSEAEIGGFCQKNYGVTFPMFAKIDVNGANAHPLYKWMKGQKPGLAGTRDVKWNFTKFLIDGEGQVVKRFGPQDTPSKIEKTVKKMVSG